MDDLRRWPRLAVNEEIEVQILQSPYASFRARLVDVSRKGLRILLNCEPKFSLGQAVAVRHGRQILLGEVIWCSDQSIGIELELLLDEAEVDRLRSREWIY